nr:hypothetical protein [Brochothrix thermosphacta]
MAPDACRVRVWDQQDIDRTLKADQGPNGDYGFGPVIEEFVYGNI